MKVCILCIGSHGDIRPYVALGIGLKARGHDVRIASHQKAEALCCKHQLEFCRVDGDLTELIETARGAEILFGSKLKKFTFFQQLMSEFKRVLEVQLPMSLAAVDGCDLLVYSPAAFAGPHMAEYFDMPAVQMCLQLDGRSRQIPSCIYPGMGRFGPAGCMLSHLLAEQQFWQPIRRRINDWRKHTLGLRKMSFWGPAVDPVVRNIPKIVAFSPRLISRPDDWPPHYIMTNFCRIKEGDGWLPPKELAAFCAQRPALYVSFGSLTSACPPEVVRSIVEVLTRNRISTIINSEFPGLSDISLPSWIFPIKYAPHDWLMPKVAGVVHHGGVGTTAATFYAGRPALVVPFIVDQFFWAEKVREFSVGPPPLSIHAFDSTVFEERIKALLTEHSFSEKAIALQQKLDGTDDGVDATIEAIFRCISYAQGDADSQMAICKSRRYK